MSPGSYPPCSAPSRQHSGSILGCLGSTSTLMDTFFPAHIDWDANEKLLYDLYWNVLLYEYINIYIDIYWVYIYISIYSVFTVHTARYVILYIWTVWLVSDCAAILLHVYSTDGNPSHGVGPARFFRLQNPGFTVNLVQDIPEHGKGFQNQQELAVELVQSTLTNQTKASKAVTYKTREFQSAPTAVKLLF